MVSGIKNKGDLQRLTPEMCQAAGLEVSAEPRLSSKPVPYVEVTDAEKDLAAIKRTGTKVDELLAETNIVAQAVAIGREYANLHERLAKVGKSDKSRIGWYAAFDHDILQHRRRQAEDLIGIYRAFIGAAPPTISALPHSVGALNLLARPINQKKLSHADLDGLEISAVSTETEVREVLIRHGVLERKTGGQNSTALNITMENASAFSKALREAPLAVQKQICSDWIAAGVSALVLLRADVQQELKRHFLHQQKKQAGDKQDRRNLKRQHYANVNHGQSATLIPSPGDPDSKTPTRH